MSKCFLSIAIAKCFCRLAYSVKKFRAHVSQVYPRIVKKTININLQPTKTFKILRRLLWQPTRFNYLLLVHPIQTVRLKNTGRGGFETKLFSFQSSVHSYLFAFSRCELSSNASKNFGFKNKQQCNVKL